VRLSLANALSAAKLVSGLVRGIEGQDAGSLLLVGSAIWLTNVIVFALWCDWALGFWAALRTVWPETTEQRCWVHKVANVLNALPKSVQPTARRMLAEIRDAEDREHAMKAIDAFTRHGRRRPTPFTRQHRSRQEIKNNIVRSSGTSGRRSGRPSIWELTAFGPATNSSPPGIGDRRLPNRPLVNRWRTQTSGVSGNCPISARAPIVGLPRRALRVLTY
jgi:hypothetical protein